MKTEAPSTEKEAERQPTTEDLRTQVGHLESQLESLLAENLQLRRQVEEFTRRLSRFRGSFASGITASWKSEQP